MKNLDSVRGSKGFLFETDDTPHPVLCRDVRGFPQALMAARERGKPSPGRLVVVVPDLAMDDWIARWADDTGRARRAITITRRTDGRQLRFTATLLTYGYGVDTAIAIERIEPEGRASRTSARPPSDGERSGVQEIVPSGRSKAAGPLKRRMAR